MIKSKRLPDGTMPQDIGEYSLWCNMYRPPYGERDEIFTRVPTGEVGALIPEHHSWEFNEDGEITVTPSIVYFSYHGFLVRGEWTE